MSFWGPFEVIKKTVSIVEEFTGASSCNSYKESFFKGDSSNMQLKQNKAIQKNVFKKDILGGGGKYLAYSKSPNLLKVY